jgi:hypothetical protein
MSANVPLSIRIAAIFDNKGLKQADKGVKGLTSSVRKLAGAAGIGLSTAAVVNFGKQAVKAFAENEKSARRLAGVVKNLGLAFETPAIEASLDRMSAKFGFEGEVLREAFQKLLTSTGSVLKSQQLLNASLDIAAGSGVDLLTVNQDLAAAYVGQTRGLRKYNLGLTQAELKTLKFDDAVAKLTSNFKGAAGAELETYSGQMRVLQEAADNAQEIIGEGLVNALMILSGDTTVDELALSMADLATNTSNAIQGLASFTDGVLKPFKEIATVLEKFILLTDPFMDLIIEGDPSIFMDRPRARAGRMFTGGQNSIQEATRAKARDKAEAASVKRAKELAALQKKTLNTQKEQNALTKASKILDLERIGIEAALKGEISATDRLSLLLQKSLLEGNESLANQLASQLEAAIRRQNEIRQLLLTTPEAPNPYRNWTLPMDLLNYTASSLGVSVAQLQTAPIPITSSMSDAEMELASAVNDFARVEKQTIAVEVYLDGDIVGGAVRDSNINSSLSGSFSTVNRAGRFFDVIK